MNFAEEIQRYSSNESKWVEITDEGLVSIVRNYQVEQSIAAKALNVLAQRKYPYLKVLALWVYMEIAANSDLKETAKAHLSES